LDELEPSCDGMEETGRERLIAPQGVLTRRFGESDMPSPSAVNEQLVTLFVNSFHYESYVGPAIDSPLAQTYPRVEVVVDDGSTDQSRARIGAFADRVRSVCTTHGPRSQLSSEHGRHHLLVGF
jgi:hypothetical protein